MAFAKTLLINFALYFFIGHIESKNVTCPFSPLCSCNLEDVRVTAICFVDKTFPDFKATDLPIGKITVYGHFTEIYDNAFHLFSKLNRTDIELIYNKIDEPTKIAEHTDLKTFSGTFETQQEYGINSLTFTRYNPVNLDQSPVSNLAALSIIRSNLTAAPTASIAANPQLSSVYLRLNEIKSIKPDDFNLPSQPLTYIDVADNLITDVDDFSEWLQVSKSNILNLSNNPKWICDSSIDWMANFVLCDPVQIQLEINLCTEDGGFVFEYLNKTATCS